MQIKNEEEKIDNIALLGFFFSSRRRHTRCGRDWSSDVCSSDLQANVLAEPVFEHLEADGSHGAKVASGSYLVKPGAGGGGAARPPPPPPGRACCERGGLRGRERAGRSARGRGGRMQSPAPPPPPPARAP